MPCLTRLTLPTSIQDLPFTGMLSHPQPLILLLCGALTSAAAQTPADSTAVDDNSGLTVLPPVVVSAGRIPQDPKRLGVSYSVIDGETIDREQQVDLRRVLQDAPSVFVSEIGARGSAASISIRGNRHQDTLIRVDGAKVSGGIIEGFSPYMAYAGTYNLETIEIIPGSQSVIYGSDTIGGTVSLFTRRGRGDPKFRLLGEIGSFESLRGAVEGDGSLEALDYSSNSRYRDATPLWAGSGSECE